MSITYYSSVLDQPTDQVWDLVRDFNNYPSYIEGVTESVIENDKRGDEIGAVRRFRIGKSWERQRLTAHSDTEYFFSYTNMEPKEFPSSQGEVDIPVAIDYTGTLELTPIIDGNRTFIEWFLDFDSQSKDTAQWNDLFMNLIPKWVNSLRRAMNKQ